MTHISTLHPDAKRWNARYEIEGKKWRNSDPRQLLLDFADQLPRAGFVLDAASGVGVHGLFLAERGCHVICLDISEVGLQLARELAMEKGLLGSSQMETAVFDLSAQPWLPKNSFDVILNFRFLERDTFPIFKRALKPGGWLLFETFIRPTSAVLEPAYFLAPDELHAAFADFEIIHSAQKLIRGGRTGQPKRVEQLVARKRINA